MSITQEEVKKLFGYNPDSGVITRNTSHVHGSNIGDVVGHINGKGYLQTKINGKIYSLHRIIWLYVYGKMPEGQIDHINHCRSDNRICNIRDVNHMEQGRNRKLGDNNTSGCIGVSWHKGRKRWDARISIDGKRVHLGSFVHFHEAIDARKNAEILYGYHENHGK